MSYFDIIDKNKLHPFGDFHNRNNDIGSQHDMNSLKTC